MFPDADEIPESNEEKFNLQVDNGGGESDGADENAFGFVVMSGMSCLSRHLASNITSVADGATHRAKA